MTDLFFVKFDSSKEIPPPTISGPCTCAAYLKQVWAKKGIDVNVSTVPPIFESPYKSPAWECGHRKLLFTEPTSEQIAFWVENKVK